MKKQDKDLLRPQEADGIQEFDNDMPRWWVHLFWICIVIGIAYTVYMHGFGGETLIQAYDKGMDKIAENKEKIEEKDMAASNAEEGSGGNLEEKLNSAAYVDSGKSLYQTNCIPCHGPDGGGGIGPNLADNSYINGNTPEDILKVISEGVPAKGMIAWKPILGRKKVEQLSAFVISLKGTTPTNPKAAQGKLYK